LVTDPDFEPDPDPEPEESPDNVKPSSPSAFTSELAPSLAPSFVSLSSSLDPLAGVEGGVRVGPGGEEINVKPDSPRAIISTDALHVLLLAPKPPASTLSLAAAAAVAVAIGLRLYSKILSVFMLPEADSSDGRAVDCVCDDEDLELVAKEASTPGGDGGVLLIMPPPFLLAVLLFRLGDVCKYPLMDFIPLRLGPASR